MMTVVTWHGDESQYWTKVGQVIAAD